MKISIYSLTSELHDEQSVSHVTQEFLHSLQLTYDWKGNHYSDYGKTGLDNSPHNRSTYSHRERAILWRLPWKFFPT